MKKNVALCFFCSCSGAKPVAVIGTQITRVNVKNEVMPGGRQWCHFLKHGLCVVYFEAIGRHFRGCISHNPAISATKLCNWENLCARSS